MSYWLFKLKGYQKIQYVVRDGKRTGPFNYDSEFTHAAFGHRECQRKNKDNYSNQLNEDFAALRRRLYFSKLSRLQKRGEDVDNFLNCGIYDTEGDDPYSKKWLMMYQLIRKTPETILRTEERINLERSLTNSLNGHPMNPQSRQRNKPRPNTTIASGPLPLNFAPLRRA